MTGKPVVAIGSADQLMAVANRRRFLKLMGAGGALVLLPTMFAACSDDDDDDGGTGPGNGGAPGSGATVTLDFSTDTGVLNYAYALEQLEAAFYAAVVGASAFNTTFSAAAERTILTDIRNHEAIHAAFLRQVLGTARIPNLNTSSTFAGVNLNDRTTVLTTARTFEDLGVAAYNGAAQYLSADANITVAGKIVSVEARHAAAIRDLLQPGTDAFAPNAFDPATNPTEVGTAAQPFVVQRLSISGQAAFQPGVTNLNPSA